MFWSTHVQWHLYLIAYHVIHPFSIFFFVIVSFLLHQEKKEKK